MLLELRTHGADFHKFLPGESNYHPIHMAAMTG